jgi:hypothetical protein
LTVRIFAVTRAVSSGAVAFVSFASCSSLLMLQSFATDIEIPVIHLDAACPNSDVFDTPFFYKFPSSVPDIEVVLLQVLLELGWSDAILLTDEYQGTFS